MYKLLSVFIFLAITSISFGQKLNHRLGEVLVEVNNAEDLIKIAKRLEAKYQSPITYKQIIDDPMNVWKLSFDHTRINEFDFLNGISNYPQILKSQFNHLISYRLAPNDIEYENQWQYLNFGQSGGITGADIKIEAAWDITTGGLSANGDTIVACVIDDGLNESHPDFGDNIWINRAEIPDNGIDDDENGFVDDYLGWNAYFDNDDIHAGGGHGTPVAGIIGAKGNNDIGVSGVNWDVKLMIVTGGGDEAQALAAYAYPYGFRKRYNETNGAEGAYVVVTNASWGVDFGQPDEAPLWCSFYDSLGQVGILNCGATINNNTNVDVAGDLPTGCGSDFLISVTNMNHFDNKETFAGYGVETIDLGAFGEGTWTVRGANGYGGFGGTSGASPHVAGTVALMHSIGCAAFADLATQDPALAAMIIKSAILEGTDPNESLEGITVTGGRLNVSNAMGILTEECSECRSPRNFTAVVALNNATLNWELDQDSVAIESVEMRYRSTDSDDWILASNVISPYTLEDLAPCTEYQIQLRSLCDTLESSFVRSSFITTQGCCSPIESFEGAYDGASESFSINWTDPNDQANYILEYQLSNSGNWNQIDVNDQQFELPVEEFCTSYDFRILSQCAFDTTDYSEVITLSSSCANCSELEYCEIDANSVDEWIEFIRFAGIQNSSGNDGGFKSFIGIHTAEVNKNEGYEFLMGVGTSASGYEEIGSVWIDYDQSGTFDSDELVLQSTTTGAIQDTIIIPADALSGYTRMRVNVSFFAGPSPCGGGFNFGESEDYCISINPGLAVATQEFGGLSLFPNPATDYINFENKSGDDLNFKHIELLDASGHLLDVYNQISIANGTQFALNLTNFERSGLIILNGTLANGKKVFKKFIKL